MNPITQYTLLRQIMWDYNIPTEELFEVLHGRKEFAGEKTEIRQKCKSMISGRLIEIASPASRDRNDDAVKIILRCDFEK